MSNNEDQETKSIKWDAISVRDWIIGAALAGITLLQAGHYVAPQDPAGLSKDDKELIKNLSTNVEKIKQSLYESDSDIKSLANRVERMDSLLVDMVKDSASIERRLSRLEIMAQFLNLNIENEQKNSENY